jgi:mannose-6-phosphate isomerase-like protein (cupin superfamily)
VTLHPRKWGNQHLSFATANFEQMMAHNGSRPILADRVLSAGESPSCRFVDLVIVPAGADIGIHRHADEAEELYVVISGTGLMHLDGMDFSVTTGDVIVNRPGGTHGLFNPGPTELKLVVIEVPVSQELPAAASETSVGHEGGSSLADDP